MDEIVPLRRFSVSLLYDVFFMWNTPPGSTLSLGQSIIIAERGLKCVQDNMQWLSGNRLIVIWGHSNLYYGSFLRMGTFVVAINKL